MSDSQFSAFMSGIFLIAGFALSSNVFNNGLGAICCFTLAILHTASSYFARKI